MKAYRYNWPAIVIINLQTQYIVLVLYDKVIIIAKNFELTSDRLLTSDFQLQILGVRFWTSVSDLDNIQLTDFSLWFQTRILDILWTSDFGHRPNSDSFRPTNFRFVRLRTSDYRLWTLDISFQTSYCGLLTYFRRWIIAFIVRHHTDVKLRNQRSIYLSHNKNKYICNQISSQNTL